MKFLHTNPVELAKEMFWLAWRACGGTTGSGFLQDRPGATKDDVWKSVIGKSLTDYSKPRGKPLQPYGDYVFGRIMKMGLTVDSDGVWFRDTPLDPEYQAWCRKYPTYLNLAEMADHTYGETYE